LERKIVREGYRFEEPLFMFKGGTSRSTTGLMRLGPIDLDKSMPFLRTWKEMKCCLLGNTPFDERVGRAFDDLVIGSDRFPGMARIFDVECQSFREVKKLPMGSESTIASLDGLAESATGFNIGLVFLDMSKRDVARIHPLIKATFDHKGIVTQVITRHILDESRRAEGTAGNLRKYQNILKNLAVEIYAKIGGIPWALSGNVASKDYVVGVSWHAIGSNYVFNSGIFNSVGVPLYNLFKTRSYDRLTHGLKYSNQKMLEETLSDLPSDAHQITLHYHGSFFKSERQMIHALEDYGKDFNAIAIESPAMPYFRLYDMEAKDNLNEKGICFVLDSKRCILSTTGLPHFNIEGTPQSMLLESAKELETKEFISEANRVYQLTQLNWTHSTGYCKLPITTMLSSNITNGILSSSMLRREANLGLPETPEPVKYTAFW
jgi:hypothetical protein